MTKHYVLDTSVLIHDPSCLTKFEDNFLYIPVTVLRELDGLKNGQGETGYHAREVLRVLDDMKFGSADCPVSTIACDRLDTNDEEIISACHSLGGTLITRDVQMRCRARMWNVPVEDYKHTRTPKALWKGYRVVELSDSWLINRVYSEHSIHASDVLSDPIENEYIVLTCGSQSVMCVTHGGYLEQITTAGAYGLTARNLEQRLALHALLDPNIALVSLVGLAGAGKTILALAAGLEQRRGYRQILLTRALTPMGGQDMLGFIPGDLSSKLQPHMMPYFDNLAVLKSNEERNTEIAGFLEKEKIVLVAPQHMRGRSLNRVFMCLDEAANLTPHEIKTLVSRMGEGSKLVVMGDINQIDSPSLSKDNNGLSYLVNKMQGQKLYAHITLTKSERSPLSELAGEVL